MTHEIGAVSFQNGIVLLEHRFQLSVVLGLGLGQQAPQSHDSLIVGAKPCLQLIHTFCGRFIIAGSEAR